MKLGMDAESDAAAEAILEAARSIGTLTAGAWAAPRILAMLCNPLVGAEEVGRVIGHEPGLAARVLRVANSAFYGLTRSVSTVDRAVVVLGLDAVRGVAAAACLERTLPAAGADSALEPDALLRHSIAVAAAAEALGRIRHRALAGEAFIAGLLHDFGLMVQLRLDPAGMHAMLRLLRSEPGAEVRFIEQQRIKIGHERCAAVVFEAWNLPESLVESVRHHHAPLAAADAHRPLAALVHAADQLALAAGIHFALEPAPHPVAPAVMDFLGLCESDFAAISAALPERAATLQRALAG